jgi:multiple sugar transport system permease protein
MAGSSSNGEGPVYPDPGKRVTRRRIPLLTWLGPLSPALALLLLFFAGPIIWSVYISFTNEALTGTGAKNPKLIGFSNFDKLLHDSGFVHSLELTLIFVVGSAVIGQNCLGLLIAILQRGVSRRVNTVINTVVIAAWVMPEVVAGFCWYAFLYHGGTLDQFLSHFGLSEDWLYVAPMFAIIIANVWRGTAFSVLVYSAALSDLPPEMIEAAEVDGAGVLARLRYVIIPLIRRAIATNLMLITLQTLASFTLIYVMTGGGPGDKSMTTPLYVYQQAFSFYDLSYGTAMSLVLLAVGAIFSIFYMKIAKVEV